MRKTYVSLVCIFCLLIGLVVPSVFAQSAGNAYWQNIRRNCPGAAVYTYYNDWVKAGTPCNNNQSQPAPLSAAQIQQNQDNADARAFNQKGLDAFNIGDYDTALSYFQQALDKTPNDTVIQQNLQNAQNKIDEKNKFNQDKRDALHDLKDPTGGGGDDSGDGLKDIGPSGGDLGLKDIGGQDGTKKIHHHKKTITATPVPTPDNGVNYKPKWGDLPN